MSLWRCSGLCENKAVRAFYGNGATNTVERRGALHSVWNNGMAAVIISEIVFESFLTDYSNLFQISEL